MITCTKYQKSIIVLASFVILVIVSSNGGRSKKQGTNPKVNLFDLNQVEKMENAINKIEFELKKKRFAIEKLKFGIEKKKKENEKLDMTNEKDKKLFEKAKIEIEKLEREISEIEKEKNDQEKELEKVKRNYNIIKDIVTDEGKIDVVFTWAGIKKTMSSRNRYNYELQFSLRSVHKYMPWVNKIYTIDQPRQRLPVLDQRGILWQVVAGLHQIAGLTNKFILFDDDMFINQPLTPDYFFTENDLPRVFQFSRRMQIYQNNTEFTDIQRPKYKFAKYTHLPTPMRRDFIVRFHQDYPEYLELVQSHYKRRYKALSEEFSMIYYEYFREKDWMLQEPLSKGKFYQISHKHPTDITQQFNRIYIKLTTKDINAFNCNDDFSSNQEIYSKQKKVLWNFYNKLYPETPDYEIPNPDHEKYSEFF
ncbi:hypothetical protein M0812_16794 [Anaeramoeba flamelloides]|uniref:Uncharacterized protein n=1 Tax=Anaeramoeba flamelloides TaxID=1746091 RepID=A0AAV7Z979_9EUKA|nr:hypothetical protein M0812_16794 [Anaeramoeba flamelloides]